MFHLLAAAFITVQPGNTLSGIASDNGLSLTTVEQDNPQISNPDLIYVGEKVYLTSSGHSSSGSTGTDGDGDTDGDTSDSTPTQGQSSPTTSSPSTSSSSSGGYSIPGMPSSLANCIAYRESTDGTNPAANGNVFGIIPASGYNVAGDSLQQQEQVAGQIYASVGGAAWAADGCPGT